MMIGSLDAARETCRRLNRRAQEAESAVARRNRYIVKQDRLLRDMRANNDGWQRLSRNMLIALVALFASYLVLAAVAVTR